MTTTQWGALDTVQAVAEGRVSAVEVVQARLDVIARRNDEVKAFVAVDPEAALAQARRVDADLDRYAALPLCGLPYAVKDVFESAELPTTYGSPIYAQHQPVFEAACSQAAKRHGAVLLGKVATGEFATQTPSAARNPLRLTHTPGGSSSGSAAAVAAGMVPVAFGTQTTGSIIRPAVYCGLVGYKPSFGLVGPAGMKTLSHSQDTVGVIARDVRDAAFFVFGLQGASSYPRHAVGKPRIALCRSRQWDYAAPETVACIDALAETLVRDGAQVDRLWLPPLLDWLATQQPRLFKFEARQNLGYEYDTHKAQLSPRLQSRMASADDVSFDEYLGIRRHVLQGRGVFSAFLSQYDALLYPAAAGEAEAGLAEAGDPRFGALWSLLHVPSVSFPAGLGPTGLPLGAQIVGDFADDVRVLGVAQYVAQLARDQVSGWPSGV